MKNTNRAVMAVICFLFLLAGVCFYAPSQVNASASKALDLEQIEQTFAQAIKNGKQTVTFTAPASYTSTQLRDALDRAAKSQNRMLSGSIQFRKQTNSASANAKYTIQLSSEAFVKIKRLTSEKAAVKAAAKALKNTKYTMNYYSDTSYYQVFVKMLQQHPEYNYNTVVWRNTNGTYGYHRGSSITKKKQKEKMEAADQAAKDAVKACVSSGMTAKQKAKAIHDYLIVHCSYNERVASTAGNQYHDAFTAYGALVKGSAVCQGYAAAFNLMAQKCGLPSMAVCGRAGGVAHAWNYVDLGSSSRYIDCTWDDTDGKKISDTYFCVTEAEMRRQHSWTAGDFPAEAIGYAKYF